MGKTISFNPRCGGEACLRKEIGYQILNNFYSFNPRCGGEACLRYFKKIIQQNSVAFQSPMWWGSLFEFKLVISSLYYGKQFQSPMWWGSLFEL